MANTKKKKRSSKTGLPPGSFIHVGEQKIENIKVSVTDFNENNLKTVEVKSLEEIVPFSNTPSVTWVNIYGLHEMETIKKIGEQFNIHPLILEDIINTDQRPKIEVSDDYVLIILKLLKYNNESNEINVEQVSIILGQKHVISFLEKEDNIFDPIHDRITKMAGRIRKGGTDYLFYSLLDVVVDNYFLVLDHLEENIEILEDDVIQNPDKSQIEKIYKLKNDLLLARRSNYPLREVFSGLIKNGSDLITNSTEPYLRDLLDHVIQVSETIDIQREMTNGLMETYLSLASNRMNEVMKLLTIIATIFIPLTFIVGIYGMNFDYMPELGWPWAYFAVLAVMLIVTIGMLHYFRKKKWI